MALPATARHIRPGAVAASAVAAAGLLGALRQPRAGASVDSDSTERGRVGKLEGTCAQCLCSARSCQPESTGRGTQRPVSSMAGPEEPGLGPKLVTAALSTFFIHFVY